MENAEIAMLVATDINDILAQLETYRKHGFDFNDKIGGEEEEKALNVEIIKELIYKLDIEPSELN